MRRLTGLLVLLAAAGKRLRPVRLDVQFWFAVAAFIPDATIVK